MSQNNKKYTSIGGQALIEGVMMKGGENIAIAIRKPDGTIDVKMDQSSPIEKWKVAKIPFVRGIFNLIASMTVGVKALTYSAEFFEEDAPKAEKGKFEATLDKLFGKNADNVLMGLSVAFALVFAILLFSITPTLLVGFLKNVIQSRIVLSLLEGVIKIGVFIIYIVVISQMEDIKRVFQYHGAEHKTIHCFESGKPVTVENAREFTRLHPRCGTSFIFFVLIISIIVFSFISWESILLRMVFKVALLPVIAGISYEILKLAGRSNHPIVKAISKPGLMMQNLTTRDPDDQQLEVAIAAFTAVLAKVDNPMEP